MIELIVVHEMRLCACPSGLGLLHGYVGLVVGSLGVGEVGVIVYMRERERECTLPVVMFGSWLDECALCSVMYLNGICRRWRIK